MITYEDSSYDIFVNSQR